MSEEIVLPKPYTHNAKNIWEACGFDPKVMEAKINAWSTALNANKAPSTMIEWIEGLDITTREKIVLAYYVCGIQGATHFERITKEMTAITAKQLELYRIEIRRLGGSVNPVEFGKKAPAKKNRTKK